ncbi:hypothetical protein [Mesorhizobium sp. WSM3876]|uniref:hypothetical protein n=1 Tax=Mesorhizobium sp. WSM3876 TaxID=422277 RepID=UPI0011410010|nr:hypothetical protein [Mesorhizobium sp. WSM3876]TGT53260.1 hypothetical protein EN813_048895 [Mesorhizobium sp. M00.F.Ca.ET.170.01.1.1]
MLLALSLDIVKLHFLENQLHTCPDVPQRGLYVHREAADDDDIVRCPIRLFKEPFCERTSRPGCDMQFLRRRSSLI